MLYVTCFPLQQLGLKNRRRQTNGEASLINPLPCLAHHKKVGPVFPAPRAAIDSTKPVVLKKEFNRYRR
jgi:hypothetical protein